MLRRLLANPLTDGLDLDSPETTALRKDIVQSKPFLTLVYEEWYRRIVDRIPEGEGMVLELGSGGGFFGDYYPEAITSDVFEVEGVDEIVDARQLPYRDGSLKAIVMTNVLHHIPGVEQFFTEAERALRSGGRILMIEPWTTSWSRFVHERFHDEPMRIDAPDWSFPATGPLSGANAALPWIIAERDKARLEADWELLVDDIDLLMPFRYVVSGGVSLRSLQPAFMFPAWRAIDRIGPIRRRYSVFAFIQLSRA